jgi:hypothetical protein
LNYYRSRSEDFWLLQPKLQQVYDIRQLVSLFAHRTLPPPQEDISHLSETQTQCQATLAKRAHHLSALLYANKVDDPLRTSLIQAAAKVHRRLLIRADASEVVRERIPYPMMRRTKYPAKVLSLSTSTWAKQGQTRRREKPSGLMQCLLCVGIRESKDEYWNRYPLVSPSR